MKEEAKRLRQEAAKHWGCGEKEICWISCWNMARRGEKLPWEETAEETAEEKVEEVEEVEDKKKNRKIRLLKAALEKKDWGWLEQSLSYSCFSEEKMKLAADVLGFTRPPSNYPVSFQVAIIMAELKQK